MSVTELTLHPETVCDNEIETCEIILRNKHYKYLELKQTNCNVTVMEYGQIVAESVRILCVDVENVRMMGDHFRKSETLKVCDFGEMARVQES